MTTPLSWRTYTNKPGTSYDASQSTKPYAEDMALLKEALETGQKTVTLTFRSYTTAQRNAIASPQEGMVIWNTDDDELQFYDGSSWSSIGGSDHTATASNPVGAPPSLAARHLNTVTGQRWEAIGTSSQSDWRELLLGGPP